MLAKMTARNRITLPKEVLSRFAEVEYFDVSTDGASITLKPMPRNGLNKVWAHIERLGITEQDVSDAVVWARERE
jgi:hypothetical protein